MKVKAAILLALTLLAFATYAIATSNFTMPKLSNVSRIVTDDPELPVQPLGDPIDGGDTPH